MYDDFVHDSLNFSWFFDEIIENVPGRLDRMRVVSSRQKGQRAPNLLLVPLFGGLCLPPHTSIDLEHDPANTGIPVLQLSNMAQFGLKPKQHRFAHFMNMHIFNNLFYSFLIHIFQDSFWIWLSPNGLQNFLAVYQENFHFVIIFVHLFFAQDIKVFFALVFIVFLELCLVTVDFLVFSEANCQAIVLDEVASCYYLVR